jgi:hypothetical protein
MLPHRLAFDDESAPTAEDPFIFDETQQGRVERKSDTLERR